MITYNYSAKHVETGEIVKAEVQADSEQSAAKLLMSQKLFPIEITSKDDGGIAGKLGLGSKVHSKDRVIFTRQLATLINAGLPLVQSLRTVREQVSNKALQQILAEVISSVEGGSTLSDSFGQHPKVFSQVYTSLVAAGETSGTLDKTLQSLANQQEKDAAIVGKIRSAMLYPVIVLGVIIAVLVFMLTTVLPQIGKLYEDLNKPLPLLTKVLVAASTFLVHFWWLTIIIIVLAAWGIRTYFKTEQGHAFADSMKLQIPIFGKIFRKVYMARYARTLGTLLGSGIPMLEALNVVKRAINNVHLEASIEKSMSKVKGGKALSSTLEGDSNFMLLVPQMIRIGEQSGAIDDMLDRVATFYENEVDEEVKNLSTTIEPLLMVVLGLTVGVVIAAILLPVYSLVGSGSINSIK